jgi:hypothetical protein
VRIKPLSLAPFAFVVAISHLAKADRAPDQSSNAPEVAAPEVEAPQVATAEVAAPEVAVSAAAATEPPAPGASQEDLQGVRADLENFKFQWQRERDLHTGITTRPLAIGGLVQAKAGGQSEPQRGQGIADRRYTFDLGAAQLIFTGNLFKDYEAGRNLTYALRFGVAPQAGTNNSFLNLIDANVTYSLVQALSPEDFVLTATLGQQALPFGLEVAASDELKPVITNAQFTTRFGLARREIGLLIRGDFGPRMDYGYNYRQALVSYAVGLISGNGPNVADDNGAKDLIGRVAFTVPSDYNSWLRQFTLGGTAYLGRQNRMLPAAKDPSRTVFGLGRKRRFGGDIYYNHHPVGVTYEYIYAEDGIIDPDASTGPQDLKFVQKHGDSHVVTLFYNFGAQFLRGYRAQGRFDDWWPRSYQPFVRYDTFDPDRAADNDRSDVYTAGFNLFFAETTKFQINYNYRHDREAESRKANNPAQNPFVIPKVHEVLAQLQFGF